MNSENEKLRAALADLVCLAKDYIENITDDEYAVIARAEDAISQLAEPAPAQDEREAFEASIAPRSTERYQNGTYIDPFVAGAWSVWQSRTAQTEQQPVQSGLIEAARGALAAIQDALEDAYHNAYQECCGQAYLECCGSPVQAWSEADQKVMDRFAPHEKALRSALAAQGGE